jgi:hypothetical protein
MLVSELCSVILLGVGECFWGGGIGDDGWIVVSDFFYFISRHLPPPSFSEEQTPHSQKINQNLYTHNKSWTTCKPSFLGNGEKWGLVWTEAGGEGGGPPLTLGTPQSNIHLTSEYNSSQGFKPWVTRFGLESPSGILPDRVG